MTAFTSPRERRLWSWALAVLIAILAGAVFAGSLVDAIGSTAVLGIAFATGLLLALVAGLGIALDHRASAKLWVGLAIGAAYLMIGVRAGVPALERTHLFEYGLLAVLLYEAMIERGANGAGVRFPGALVIVLTAGLGWVDEAIQALVPGRVYDLRDVAVNAIAAVVAVTAVAALRWSQGVWVRRRARERSDS
jgi:hypothetical protein